MNNEELKKRILETIQDLWIDYPPEASEVADALIAAGIGDVKEAEAEANRYEMLYKMQSRDMALAERKAYESEHRAEVYKRALHIAHTAGEFAYYVDKAEKELAEENSGKKKFSAKVRQQVYDKCNGHCAYCGCELDIKDMQIDHVQSLYWHNGSNEMDNLLPACRSCNHYKGSSTLENFRKNLEHMPQVLMRDCVTYKIATRYGLVIPNEQKVVFYFEKLAEERKDENN